MSVALVVVASVRLLPTFLTLLGLVAEEAMQPTHVSLASARLSDATVSGVRRGARVARASAWEVEMAHTHKPRQSADALSARDQRILDALLSGQTESAVAAQFGLTQPRISQIKHTTAALRYVVAKGHAARTEVYAIAIGLIHARLLDAVRGDISLDLDTLIKIAKISEPKQDYGQCTFEFLYAEAIRIADEYEMVPATRAQFLGFVARSAVRWASCQRYYYRARVLGVAIKRTLAPADVGRVLALCERHREMRWLFG
jgi:hypothetical protein